MQTPDWALLLAFWLHMLATVVWLGGLAGLALLVLPAMRRGLDAESFADWLRELNRRLDPIGWFSLGLLTATGLVQMGANPNYEGLLYFGNNWAMAILLKHLAFFGMVGVSSIITWRISPALQRAALRRAQLGDDGQEAILIKRLQGLIGLNSLLGGIVLAFTALARIA
jgi:uncharacterized membrane protein